MYKRKYPITPFLKISSVILSCNLNLVDASPKTGFSRSIQASCRAILNPFYKNARDFRYQNFANISMLSSTQCGALDVAPKPFHNHNSYRNFARFLGLSLAGTGVATYLIDHHAEAKGYRGKKGYRPYDCRWGDEFKCQAEEALASADKFERIFYNDKVSWEHKQQLGLAVLMDLIWAQDQGEHLINKHYFNYKCWVFRSFACWDYEDNLRLRNRYHNKLERRINSIRDMLGVPHPLGWEERLPAFMKGAAQSLGIFAAVSATGPAALVAGGVFLAYKGYRNVFDQEAVLDEEEHKIAQELYVKAACADEYSLKQAMKWGGYSVTAVIALNGVMDLMDRMIDALEKNALKSFQQLEIIEIETLEGAVQATEALEAAEALEIAEAAEALEMAEVAEAGEAAEALEAAEAATEAGEALEAVESLDLTNATEACKGISNDPYQARDTLCEELGVGKGQDGFSPFTKGNYRHNLKALDQAAHGMKRNIPSNTHAHHILPQKHAARFQDLGVNINDPRFMAWMKDEAHRQLHSGGAYNKMWAEILNNNPSKETILNTLFEIIKENKLDSPFVVLKNLV